MGKYKIRIYAHAKKDLKGIISYLNKQPPAAAIKYYDLLVEKIIGLSENPKRCPFVREIALKANGYRYLIVEGYLVLFVTKDDTVQIRRIIYGKSRLRMAIIRNFTPRPPHLNRVT